MLDLTLPGLHGLEVVRQVTRKSEATAVVILSMHTDEAHVLGALRNGAERGERVRPKGFRHGRHRPCRARGRGGSPLPRSAVVGCGGSRLRRTTGNQANRPIRHTERPGAPGASADRGGKPLSDWRAPVCELADGRDSPGQPPAEAGASLTDRARSVCPSQRTHTAPAPFRTPAEGIDRPAPGPECIVSVCARFAWKPRCPSSIPVSP